MLMPMCCLFDAYVLCICHVCLLPVCLLFVVFRAAARALAAAAPRVGAGGQKNREEPRGCFLEGGLPIRHLSRNLNELDFQLHTGNLRTLRCPFSVGRTSASARRGSPPAAARRCPSRTWRGRPWQAGGGRPQNPRAGSPTQESRSTKPEEPRFAGHAAGA